MENLKVTRDQLAEFLENHNTIRQFERLFERVNSEAFIQNIAHPVGDTYWQFPDKQEPMDLFPAQTWENISSEFAGDFFRAEGGDAETFEGGEQAYAIKEHEHDRIVQTSTVNGTNAYLRVNTGSGTNPGGFVGGVDTSTARVGADEGRPVNQTIRIWERTA